MNRLAITLLIFSCFVTNAFGQLKLTGKVTDINNAPIELATIKLEGLGRIAMSNDSGYFHMNLPGSMKKGDLLVADVSKEGYKNAVRSINISDTLVVIILDDNSPAKAIKPVVHTVKFDTTFYHNKSFAVQQVDTVAPRKLNADNLKAVFYSLSSDKSKRICIECVKDDAEALRFATSLHDTLVLSGYTNVSDVAMVDFPQPVIGQFINRDASGVKITIGHKP
jgi:hypothetical protein